MTHEDWPIWFVWRDLNLLKEERYYYNVRLGVPVPAPETAPENYRRQWELSSLFRIDALGVSQDRITIYEIKSRALTSDLWQLNTYRTLLHAEVPGKLTIDAWLIAESLPDSLQHQASLLNLKIWSLTTSR
jgi:hypothetical protein